MQMKVGRGEHWIGPGLEGRGIGDEECFLQWHELVKV